MSRREKINPVFDNFIVVSPKQIELALYVRQYRKLHNLSMKEMAYLCSLYGKDQNVRFTYNDIFHYENCKHVPTPPKFQILMNTMDLDPSML